ncbi:MAG: hypothetical protein SGBAC_011198 [Bacillariaceae sp.]
MEEGKPLDENSCSRGLEQYLTVNVISNKHNVRRAIQVVLDLQDRQFELTMYDDQAISKAYQNVSSSCHLWAAVVGLRDRQEAADAYDDNEDKPNSGDFLPSNHMLKESVGRLAPILKEGRLPRGTTHLQPADVTNDGLLGRAKVVHICMVQ